MDRLWIKATSLFETAVLLTWSKGKASASGHYHYHFTIFLPACYMGFPLQIFFFSIFCADWFTLIMPGKISKGKCTWDWWGREDSYIWSFLCLYPSILSFLLEGGIVIYVVLVKISYICRVLTFKIFCRSLYSTANNASSRPLVSPYFTQPTENYLTYFSVENLSRTSLGRSKKRRYSYSNISWFRIFIVLVLFHSLRYLIFDFRPLKK